MTELFKMAGESPILTVIGLYFFFETVMILGRRVCRMFMVMVRGWPPGHLDADGDFKEIES